MNRETKIKKRKKITKQSHMDYSLLFIILFLICFGFVMLYSTSSYMAFMKFGNSRYFLDKQIISTILGLICMSAIILIGYERLRIINFGVYPVAIVALFAILTPLGYSANGARRWINIVGQSVQPAEIAKIGTILFLAHFIHRNRARLGSYKKILELMIISIIPSVLIIVLTKNLSSAVIVFGISFIMLFVASTKPALFILILAIAGIGLFVVLNFGEGFRMERIDAWNNPEKYKDGTAYQTVQSLYAIFSGGLVGKGLGQSVQKLGSVPEAQNDMIFSIICEELGLFGAVSIILLFLFLIWRMYVIANNAKDLYGSMIAIGVMAHISIQVFFNIAVVTNTLPNTGVTLPFISYGGTSIVFLLCEMGYVLSISKNVRDD